MSKIEGCIFPNLACDLSTKDKLNDALAFWGLLFCQAIVLSLVFWVAVVIVENRVLLFWLGTIKTLVGNGSSKHGVNWQAPLCALVGLG